MPKSIVVGPALSHLGIIISLEGYLKGEKLVCVGEDEDPELAVGKCVKNVFFVVLLSRYPIEVNVTVTVRLLRLWNGIKYYMLKSQEKMAADYLCGESYDRVTGSMFCCYDRIFEEYKNDAIGLRENCSHMKCAIKNLFCNGFLLPVGTV